MPWRLKTAFLFGGLGLCALLPAPAVRAGDTGQKSETRPETRPETGAISFVYENDVFYDTDREYTNGVRLAWVTGPGVTPEWVLAAARRLPFFPVDAKIRTTYAVGQNMYTPGDITVADPAPGERPYAGWLYGSIGLIVEWGETLNRLDQLDLSVGVVGPASLAEQTQRFVHNHVTNSPDPKGWDTQLKNEPGVVLTYQRSWRRFIARRSKESITGLGFDVVPHVGAAIGNVYTYANAGLTLRVGADLPRDYGPPRIQPSLPGAGFFERRDGLGWYLFAGVEGRAVARNIFLDGNTFTNSRSVEKESLVGDLQYGFAVTWRNARLSYTHVVRTREYEGESGDDNFGALSLSVRF